VAHDKFKVEVLTPEGEVFNDEVEMVSTRTGTGSIGIRAHHTPLLAGLDPTELRLYTSENDYESFAQGEGYLQMYGNRALILVEEAVKPDELDRSDIESRLQTAENELEQAEEDSEEERRAQRDKRRWEAFLRVESGETPGSTA
jgi:F-type H+-transporting ATPase subunit epsilon